MPVSGVYLDCPLLLDMKKMSTSMAMTAIQEIMQAILRWLFAGDLRILGIRSVVCSGLGSVFVSHNASQSSKNVPARRGRAGTFTKGAGVDVPLSAGSPCIGGLAKTVRP